ncbi:MAG: nucleotidyltransferase [Nitriliruptorales bacterium]
MPPRNPNTTDHSNQSTPAALDFYGKALAALADAGIPFLVGGGYAVHVYTGIARMTKDFDLFVLPEDVSRVLQTLAAAGYHTELTYPHWLAKVYSGKEVIDVIFSSGNGMCRVDQGWFEHATDAVVLNLAVKVCPPEESIWQKAFIMERDRFDGADIAHLLRVRAGTLDWPRLLERFGPHWRVLFMHLVMFGFIYSDEQTLIPAWVMHELLDRFREQVDHPPQADHVCRGTLFSREQYQIDVEAWGYQDPRLTPLGRMTATDLAKWTPVAGNGEQAKRE